MQNNIADFIFFICSINLIVCTILTLYSKHPIYSLLYLVGCFLSASMLLFVLECEFLALLFIIIYVGAIAVLFLFAVMMLDFKYYNIQKNTTKYFPVGAFFGFLLVSPILFEIYSFFPMTRPFSFIQNNNYRNWFDLIDATTETEAIGHVLYSYFVLQFLLIGLILLVVLLGVNHLTNVRKKKKKTNQALFKQLSRSVKLK